jgi:hypothetical protein
MRIFSTCLRRCLDMIALIDADHVNRTEISQHYTDRQPSTITTRALRMGDMQVQYVNGLSVRVLPPLGGITMAAPCYHNAISCCR